MAANGQLNKAINAINIIVIIIVCERRPMDMRMP